MDDSEIVKKSRFFSVTRLVILFVILGGALALYINYATSQRAGRQQVYDNLAVFESRLQNVENGISSHEKRIAALEQASAKPVSGTSQTSANGAEAERIAALEKEVATLKSAPSMQGNEQLYHSIQLLSAFHRLSEKVIGGKPFAAELSAYEDLAGDDAASSASINALAPYADNGVPTYAAVLSAFDDAVGALDTAQSVAPADATMWERFKFNIMHLISIRRMDAGQTGNAPDAIVARAEQHLESMEPEAAIAEIKSLPDTLRPSFNNWLEEARIYTEAPALIDQIEETMMQKAFHTQDEPTDGKGH